MKVIVKYGDPMRLETHKTVTVDTQQTQAEVQKTQGLGHIHSILYRNAHTVRVGDTFSDGLNDIEVLSIEGPRLVVGEIYNNYDLEDNLPIKILKDKRILGIRFCYCKLGFTGTVQKIQWKSEFALLSRLRGQKWLSWLP
jgi:hypothetical protein